MDQANEQSIVDTPAAAPENAAETHAENESTAGTEFDAREIGNMSEDDQFVALKAAGIFGDNADTEPETKPEPKEETKPVEQSEEPMVTVKVDGQEMQVKQSELVAGYQRGADYTRKTQELAAEKKRYNELLEKVAMGKADKPEAPKPVDTIKEQYDAATAEVERRLGLQPGDFNQFDSVHSYALQQVQLENNSKQLAQRQLAAEINDFVAQAQRDPMAAEIDNNFDAYMFKMGAESAEGQNKALVLMASKARFLAGQATRQDTEILKAHWDYVKSALTAKTATAPITTVKKNANPPMTEAPGAGKVSETRQKLDNKKLRTMNTDSQFETLKKLGILG